MKKILSLLIMSIMLLGVSSFAFANTEGKIQDDSRVSNYEWILESSEEVIVSEKVIKENPFTRSEYHEVTYEKIVSKSDDYKLYCVDINNYKVPAGSLTLEGMAGYTETWLLNQNNTKIKMISRSSKEIIEADRDYHALVGFTIWVDDFDEGIGTNKCKIRGKVDSEFGGTEAFSHYLRF